MEGKEGKLETGRWKIEMEGGKSVKMRRGLFFFFFFFHFSKRRKFVLGLPKWKFSAGKKIWKNDFAPSEKIPVTPLILGGQETIILL